MRPVPLCFLAMHTVRLALAAMATRFELVLHGSDPVQLRAAGEEALQEITMLEEALSFYRPASELSRVNRQAASHPVAVSPRLFQLLMEAQRLYHDTDGAFDVTIGPLMKCWGFADGSGVWPAAEALDRARDVTGMHLVELDRARRAVRFARAGVQIDLGAIGKGYAIEEAAAILRACGIESAFLHGGTSTMIALGQPPDQETWKVAITGPDDCTVAAVVPLRDEALSVSAASGKAFREGETTYGHVIDPRTGIPVQGALVAAATHASATVSDALSTALLALGCGDGKLASAFGNSIRTLVFCGAAANPEIQANGITPLAHA